MASESTTGGTRHSRYLVFGASSVALLMSSIDATIVATALPTMTRELATSITWSSWAVTAYLLGQTVAMPLAGKLSDSLGRRRMFLAYVATFTLASLACGLALNVYVLIVFRFIQALGGGGFMPSAMGVVSDNFGRDRDRAIGLFSSVFPLGAMLGPALGGFLVGYWSWRGSSASTSRWARCCSSSWPGRCPAARSDPGSRRWTSRVPSSSASRC